MKKLYFVIAIFLSFSAGIFAQNVDDILRYSQVFYGGTARFNSMGGAFTAIGGDISTLSQNPAGIGVFRSSELSISPQLSHIKSNAAFHGSNTDYIYNFNLGQGGLVSNLISLDNGLISLNFGYSYSKTSNLNQVVRIQGNSTSSSMADFWANSSDGIFFRDLQDAAGIAYDAWIIDTITGSGGVEYGTVFSNYGDNPPSVYGQNIRRLINNEGFTAEHALSVGGNYENKIYFGVTLGINRINYTSHYEHMESTSAVLPSEFRNFTFTDHFENTGTGYSIKMGAIIRPVEMLRIGLAFHSPTWYRINEYFTEDIVSNFEGGARYNASTEPARYRYGVTTPFRALAGAAVQIGKLGLLSADYEFVDYSTARFRAVGDNEDYSEKNLGIKSTLQPVHNFRLGGELRLNKFYLRSGYGYYGRAFQSGEDNMDLKYNVISGGIGFREQRVFIDLGFSNTNYDQVYIMYPVANNAAASDLNTNKNNFTLTVGLKF